MVETSSIRSVCFVGLGQIGIPMAGHLAHAGFAVTGYDLSPGARERAATTGLSVAEEAATAAAGTDAVITMLPTGAIVRQALLGPGGILSAENGRDLVIDMSSSAPGDTVSLGADLAARDVALVDAPVSGGRKKAVEGTLTIMVGGNEASTERARPLFEAMGERIFACGPLGAGHAMKALNNYVSGAGAVAAMEAILVGQNFGLDPEAMVDILNVSTGRNNTTEAKMKQFVLSRSWGSGFGLGLMAKDIGIAADLARERGVPARLLPETAELWARAAEALEDGTDHTEIFRYLEKRDRE